MEQDEKVRVSEAMIKYGGSFVNKLGQLLQSADHVNAEKIKTTWPQYWNDYKAFSIRDEKQLQS